MCTYISRRRDQEHSLLFWTSSTQFCLLWTCFAHHKPSRISIPIFIFVYTPDKRLLPPYALQLQTFYLLLLLLWDSQHARKETRAYSQPMTHYKSINHQNQSWIHERKLELQKCWEFMYHEALVNNIIMSCQYVSASNAAVESWSNTYTIHLQD